MKRSNRREFLGGIGKSALCATLGYAFASRLGFAGVLSARELERLRFGALDELVDLLQATPADELMPLLVGKLKNGTSLAELVGAGALANARAFGGTHYNGYHTLMALAPSLEMAAQMPTPLGPLPVLKVLHRNARFLQESGQASEDTLHPVEPGDSKMNLAENLRTREIDKAESIFATELVRSRERAYEDLQAVVRDDIDVHRVVLAWRAFDLLRVTGQDQALTMLRQSVRHCIDADRNRASRGQGPAEVRALLSKLLDEHELRGRAKGTRAADDAWIEELGKKVFAGDRSTAAAEVAAALAQGFDPEDIGRALSLAAAHLLLNDAGQTRDQPGKPIGSVHGASVGVHASDAANAWKHLARVSSNDCASANLIVAAYHTAGQSQSKLAHDHDRAACELEDPAKLIDAIGGKIRERDQAGAMQAARRYTQLGHEPQRLFATLLPFAVSEDGALHAEKFFRTAQEEHANARPAQRGIYLVALTRVMASHHGFPAPGVAETTKLLSS